MANFPVPNPSGWLSIFSKLGLQNFGRWLISDTIVPVAIVDSEVTLNASSSTPLVNVPASAGEVGVPAAATRLATTGALPAGPYTMTFWVGVLDTSNASIRIRRRNAADTADIWSFRFSGTAGFSLNWSLRLNLAVNEFVVVENVALGSAGSVYQASIFVVAG